MLFVEHTVIFYDLLTEALARSTTAAGTRVNKDPVSPEAQLQMQ